MSSNSYTVAARRAALNARHAAERSRTASTPLLAAAAAEAAQVHANKAHDAAGDAGTPAAHLWAIAAQGQANAAAFSIAALAVRRRASGLDMEASPEALWAGLDAARAAAEASLETIRRDRRFASTPALQDALDLAEAALVLALND